LKSPKEESLFNKEKLKLIRFGLKAREKKR